MLRPIRHGVLLFFAYSMQLLAQAPNDECATATVIPSLPFQIQQDSRLATSNPSDPSIYCQDSLGNGKTVWFRYTADSTRFVVFSTIGSQPMEEYDIVMGIFTGTCGALTLVRCNDDTLDVRQSMIGMYVSAGTTYHVMVGEWGGGGVWGGVPTGGDLNFSVFPVTLPALYRGPKIGTLKYAVVTRTENFPDMEHALHVRPKLRKPTINKSIRKLPAPPGMTAPTGEYGSNYHVDRTMMNNADMSGAGSVSRPVAIRQFEGIPQTPFIPPDPIIAAGPEHLMIAVNSAFRIFDKQGTVLKTIDTDLWYDQVLPGASTFDPIVMYDHFARRWIMVMLHVDDRNRTGAVFLSVSDDDDPLGAWYHWPMPAHMIGDSAVSNWTDYARVGFDEHAIYITGNQFNFTIGFDYAKVRIVPKADVYSNSGRGMLWYDYWDLRNPENRYDIVSGIRPTIVFGSPGQHFLLNDSPYFLGTFFTLWTIDSLRSVPRLSARNVPVVQYFPAPNADQKEGSTLTLEAYGSEIRSEAVYRDSVLWAVHSVASGSQKEYSAIRYVGIDPATAKAREDIAFGVDGFWHSYPALMVNAEGEMTIAFCRSGREEYIGAYMTGRRKNDVAGLSPSIMLREGRGNYVVDFNSGRNRWGDYSGIALDPTDQRTVWMHTEFAAAKNRWGTWVAKTVMGPVPGAVLTTDRSFITFGTKNVGTSSDTVSVTLTNDGESPLAIASLLTTTSSFRVITDVPFPWKIPSLGSVTFRVTFVPTIDGPVTDTVFICTSSPCDSVRAVTILSGTGFLVVPAERGVMYAASGSADGGRLYTVNTSNGDTQLLHSTGLPQITSLRVHPGTKELIALEPTGSLTGGTLYKISAGGPSYKKLCDVAVTNLKGMTFLNDSIAYMADFNGRIFRVHIGTGAVTQLLSTGLRIGGLALNPVDGSLWCSLRATSGIADALYRIDLSTSSVTLKGRTGLSVANSDLVFDKNGGLYVLSGTAASPNSLIVVDTADGKAVRILETGRNNLTSFALNPDALAQVTAKDPATLPSSYTLEQNYPNPFNPLTTIEYTVPVAAHVTIRVVDLLGRVVQTLADGIRLPGTYKEYFDGSSYASGIYYCHMTAGTFRATRSLMLMK